MPLGHAILFNQDSSSEPQTPENGGREFSHSWCMATTILDARDRHEFTAYELIAY